MFVLPGLAHWLPPKDSTKTKKIDFSKLLVKLPNVQNAGKWGEKYGQRLEEAKLILEDYKETSTALDTLFHESKKNRYHWRLFKALNEFQITAPRLLLALKQCDTKKKSNRLVAVQLVRNELKKFDIAWENLKDVYAETRFISYPSNYVPDRYYHFASQREDLTWMIQVEELLHKMINEWIEGDVSN